MSLRIIGAIHLPAFTRNNISYSSLRDWLLENAAAYDAGGIRELFIQDQTPGPAASVKTIAYMASLVREVRLAFPAMKLGVILEANDPAVLPLANAAGADFVRIKVYVGAMVKAGGIIQGCAAQTLRERAFLDRPVEVLTDVYDRTGTPLGGIPLVTAAQQAVKYESDGLILTGRNTEETLEMIAEVKKALPGTPVYAGGGVNAQNIPRFVDRCDGVVVSSCFMTGSETPCWDAGKIREFLQKLAQAQTV